MINDEFGPLEGLERERPASRSKWHWAGFDWEEARHEVDQESRGRILLVGLKNAGKSTLLNRLCGWTVSQPAHALSEQAEKGAETDWLEDFGLFCLIDLPEGGLTYAGSTNPDLAAGGLNAPVSELLPLELAAEADLLVYLLDGAAGVRPADYAWLGRLRRLGTPLVVVLNKWDLLADPPLSPIEERLATAVLPVSALRGSHVLDGLIPRIVDACPKLAVPLGRELRRFRRQMAGRLIRSAALFNGLVALEPVPLLDIPLQMLTLVKLVLRLGLLYDHPPTDAQQREVLAAIAGGLAGRYAAQQALKLIPLLGWLASGGIAAATTGLVGWAAVNYFEAGGDAALGQRLRRAPAGLRSRWQSQQTRWRERITARLRQAWPYRRRLRRPRLRRRVKPWGKAGLRPAPSGAAPAPPQDAAPPAPPTDQEAPS